MIDFSLWLVQGVLAFALWFVGAVSGVLTRAYKAVYTVRRKLKKEPLVQPHDVGAGFATEDELRACGGDELLPYTPGPLPIPPEVDEDPLAVEILRVWIGGDHNQYVTLNVVVWRDIRVWGIFLSDVLQHIVQGITEAHPEGPSYDEVHDMILDMFEAEVENPTDKAKGAFYE